jgi:hypothetical protein
VLVLRYEAKNHEQLQQIQSTMEEWLTTQGVAVAAMADH